MENRTLGDWIVHAIAYGSSMASGTRRHVYFGILFVALLVIWGPTVTFLKLKKPSYSSEWVLLLPDASSGHAVSLESVGQASRSASSPYANQVIDPRVNYKSIASSFTVIAEAARLLDMTPATFGRPQIKLADQTSLMEFRIDGASADLAQAKAEALKAAFERQLVLLRADELEKREQAATQSLKPLNDKLAQAQQDIVDFQLEAGVVSIDQFYELAQSVETLRQEKLRLEIEREGLERHQSALVSNLNLKNVNAAEALALQSDKAFQQLIADVAEAATTLAASKAELGPRHFKVMRAGATVEGLQQGLQERAAELGVRWDGQQLNRWIRNASARPLMVELVDVQSRLARVEGEIAAHEEQIQSLSLRVSQGAQKAVALEDLQRKQQVAMTVFSTALAKLDLGRTDVYASYPMLQTMLSPTLPEKPNALAATLAILGAIAGSLMCMSALVLLWIRKPYIQKIFLNESSGSL